MTRLVRSVLPQRLRLRLWLLRNWFTRESFLLRRARPSVRRRAVAGIELARRSRTLGSAARPVGVDRLRAVNVINLASRPDRLASFTGEMRKLAIGNVERFEAIEHEVGIIGCGMSHAACLRQALAAGDECAMICEDDAVFLVDRRRLDVLVDSFLDDPRADVACLAYFASRSAPYDRLFLRGRYIRTMACYLVKARVAPELLELWERGLDELRRGGSRARYGCDKVWFPLQERRVFLIPIVRAARQAPGYSDVEGRDVSYTH